MKSNIGSVDQMVRIVVAAVIGVLYYLGYIGGTLGLVLTILAVVFLLTGFFKFCPLYAIFGMKSKK